MTNEEEKKLEKLAREYCSSKGLNPRYDSKYSDVYTAFKAGWEAFLYQK